MPKVSLLQKPKICIDNISKSQQDVDILWQETTYLRKKVAQLTNRNESLEEKMRTNSKNSSIPPSQDLYKKKIIKKKKSKLTQGAQKGHTGTSRELLPSSEVDYTQNCLPSSSCSCGGSVQVQFGKYSRHQQYELPEISPKITEYRLILGKCADCKKEHKGCLPTGVPTGMLGSKAMSMTASLTGDYRISRRETQRLLKNHFSLPLGLGTISNVEHEVSKSLEESVEEAKKAVKKEKIVHADETSHKKSGIKQWMWVAVTKSLSVFIIRPTRSALVAKELLGELFQGILVSDRFSSYNWVDTARRQFCWAHLIRDILKISQRSGIDQRIASNLLAHIKWMFLLWYKVREGDLSRKSFQLAMKLPISAMENLLQQGAKSTNKKTRGTCAQILKKKEALWTFIHTQDLEPTNNIAERTIRAYVLWRKMSFGSQSDRGNLFIERMMTVRASCRQQDRDVYVFLQDAVCAYYGKNKSPSLIPQETLQLQQVKSQSA